MLLYAGAQLLSAVYLVWYIRYRVQFVTLLRFEGRVRTLLHQKSGRISCEALETPDAYAFLRQADGARQSLFRFGEIWVESLFTFVQAAMIAGYLSSFQPWFLLFLPLSALSTFLTMLFRARLWERDYARAEACRREETEYERALTDESACKETRMTGADVLLLKRREESRREPAVQVEKIAVKASGNLTAEKKAAADRRASGERSSQHPVTKRSGMRFVLKNTRPRRMVRWLPPMRTRHEDRCGAATP